MGGKASQESIQVNTGSLKGRPDHGVTAFLGIPYAAAPFGRQRLRPPARPPAWEGVRLATDYGPTCPKGSYPAQYASLFPEVVIGGGECLNLNVWTPDPGGSGLPVLVWIHGGSFVNGSGSVTGYRGSSFARDGVVCVTINYRLGAEGFLYLGDGPANLGLLDQIAALQWVQENIAAFGGDPARVTVAGHSAGAMSITALLAMPCARGLFAQAITQSGAAAHTLSADTALQVARILAESLDVAPTHEEISRVAPERLAQAASAMVNEVQTAPDPAKWGQLSLNLLPFAPVIDGETLPGHPLDELTRGAAAGVRLLTGTNHEEARLFLVPTGAIELIDKPGLSAMASAYGVPPAAVETYRARQPGGRNGDVLAAIITDWYYRIPSIRVVEARVSAGNADTWMYRFDHGSQSTFGRLGAAHAVEIQYVFDTLDDSSGHALLGKNPSQAVADTAHGAWVRFAAAGDPGWDRYGLAERTTALIKEEIVVAIKCAFTGNAVPAGQPVSPELEAGESGRARPA